jgi:predicted Zn-dependent protease
VKRTFASTVWSAAELAADVAAARVDLGHLARPAHRVAPGRYRAWLTPAALGEIWDLYGYGHLGAQAQESRSSALGRLVAGDVALDARVHLHDHVGSGLAPAFQGDGFPRDALIPLIEGGRAVGRFVSPRSAVEYGLRTNGADANEGFVALEMAAGELADADVLAALGTGVYVSNLWYLNHSDRNAARVTGMTRFATFWVEDGRIVAPLAVMRFDDSLYDLLGGRLLAIGARRALLPSTSTYGGRVAVSQLLPGVLIDGLTFTL